MNFGKISSLLEIYFSLFFLGRRGGVGVGKGIEERERGGEGSFPPVLTLEA